jgi:hypothetical protein
MPSNDPPYSTKEVFQICELCDRIRDLLVLTIHDSPSNSVYLPRLAIRREWELPADIVVSCVVSLDYAWCIKLTRSIDTEIPSADFISLQEWREGVD